MSGYDATPAGRPVADESWERLDPRMLLIGPVRAARQFAVPFLIALIGIRTSDGAWGARALPLLVLGALVAGALPWLTTYFRSTDTQLQVRRGVLRRTVVTAPLDRVRSVDLESSLLHRLLGLTTVTIGTGVDETRIELDSLSTASADRLRVALLRRAAVAASSHAPEPDAAPAPGAPGAPSSPGAPPTPTGPVQPAASPAPDELARIDWSWLRFAPFSLSRLVVLAAMLGALSQFTDNLPVDRLDDAWQWLGSQALPVVLAGTAVLCLVGWVVVSVGGYVLRWWDLRLVRHDGNLRLTAGLFTTRSTSIEEARIRGVVLSEPLLLRAVGGADLSTLATGVGSGGVTTVLPPCPVDVAARVGTAVLEDERPLTVQLRPHGPDARRRCHVRAQRPTMVALGAVPVLWLLDAPGWAVGTTAVAAAVLALAGAVTGVMAYRHLGHALAPGHLVSGAGALQRTRTVLERDGIIGWVVRQSWFQRRSGLATLVATTAAGPERVVVVDVPAGGRGAPRRRRHAGAADHPADRGPCPRVEGVTDTPTTDRAFTERVRAHFPALDLGVAHFDGPGGSQTPSVVADAVARTMTAGVSNRGTVTDAEQRAERIVDRRPRRRRRPAGDRPSRGGVRPVDDPADLRPGPHPVADWGPGDEVVVTRLDHDANIRPWVLAAERAGATVRWLGFDPETAELDDIETVLSTQTRLVAVTGASNLFGTRPDVPAIAAAAHEVDALVYVDAVHLTPHAAVDRTALGADLLACSPYKFFGPHLGALAADRSLLERLSPDKLLPSSDAVPERFELGTLPYELLAGVTAAVDFIADLASEAGERRARIEESMAYVERHEDALLDRLLDGLSGIDTVTLHGRPARRTPTVLFSVAGRTGREVHEALAKEGVNAPASNFYAIEASRHAGLGDDGAVRAGLAPYTSVEDVDRLVAGVAALRA